MKNKKLFIFGIVLTIICILTIGACFIWTGFPYKVYSPYFPIISGMFFFGFVGLIGGIMSIVFGGAND